MFEQQKIKTEDIWMFALQEKEQTNERKIKTSKGK